jgi:glutathione reductase (NADPH)
METDHDVIVLGAGNAGIAAARVAREAGKSVLLVERRELGGTCPLRGCVPKKVLVAAAETLDAVARAPDHGIEIGSVRLDWPYLIERKRSLIANVSTELAATLEELGVRVLHGRARLIAAHDIEVDGSRYRAKKIVIGVGSVPRPLAIDGAEHLKSSDDVLELAELPRSIVFVGAGVIAMEFAHVLSRAGARVTLLEAEKQPLLNFDSDLVMALLAETRRLGVEVECGVSVSKIARRADNGFTIDAQIGGKVRQLEADLVVNGTGRIADFSELGLEQAGVRFDGKRPKLDRYLRSESNPDLLFAGDAVPGTPQLSPLATYEGSIAAKNAIAEGELEVPDYDSVPAVVFTVPALARVGMMEADARNKGLDFEVKDNDLTGWRSGRTYAETAARSKVLLEQGSGRILGAHLLGHGAQETIHAFAFHIKHGLPASALGQLVMAYPTFHADLKHML